MLFVFRQDPRRPPWPFGTTPKERVPLARFENGPDDDFSRLKIQWLYLLILMPFFTKWVEMGRVPNTVQEVAQGLMLGLVPAIFIWFAVQQAKGIEQAVHVDSLTGLFNSQKLHLDLRREIKRARRQEVALSLAYLDLDHFKIINDRHSHAEGDAVLKRFSDLLQKNVRRDVDTCYRAGGDEFAIILPGIQVVEAEKLFQRMSGEIRQHLAVLSLEGVGVSVGVVELMAEESSQTFLKRSDAAMYQVKKTRKEQNRS